MMQPENTSVIDTTPAFEPDTDAIHQLAHSEEAPQVDTPVHDANESRDAATAVRRDDRVQHASPDQQPNGHQDGHEQPQPSSASALAAAAAAASKQGPASPPPSVSRSASISTSTSRLSTPPPHLEEGDSASAVAADTAASSTNGKKRKLAEIQPDPRSRSASRPISPPWKKFGAEGPTAFLEDGKRRSGRVNAVPLTLQPSTGKRQTRSKQPLQPQQPQQTPVPRSHRKGESGANAQQTPSSRAAASKPTTNGTKSTPKTNALKHETSPKPAKKEEDKDGTTNGGDAVMKDPPAASSLLRKTSARLRRTSQNNQAEVRSDNKPKLADRLAQSSPRIKLKLRRTESAYIPRHPSHIPAAPLFPSLEEALDAVDAKEKELEKAAKIDENYEGLERARPLNDRERGSELNLLQLAEKEARTRLRILDSAQPGGALSKEKSSLFLPDEQSQPPTQYGHADHLWAQGHYFRVLMDREKRLHIEQARKFAYACMARWKEKQPQTEEEKQREERAFFQTVYRQLVKDVGRKWELVGEEINRRRHARWEVEEKKRREKRMQEVMERSTNLLDARKAAREAREESLLSFDDSMNGDAYELGSPATASDEGDDDGEDTEDSDIMSESGSDSEDEGGADDPDANLSPEALRRKYSSLPDLPLSPDPPDDDDEDDEEKEASDVEIENDHDDGNDDDDDVTAPISPRSDDMDTPALDTDTEHLPADPDRDYANIQLEEVDDALLDDSDESINMSDEDMTSEEEDDRDEEDEGSEEEDDDVGLLGFLNGRERQVVQDAELSADDSQSAVGGAEEYATPAEHTDEIMPDQPVEHLEEQSTQDKQVVPPTNEQLNTAQSVTVSADAEVKLGEPDVTMNEPDTERQAFEMSPDRNMLSVDSHGEDRSSQLSPKDDTTAEPTEADSTTSIDAEDAAKISESNDQTPPPNQETRTKVPSLLRGTLREYQHEGLDWLAKLYANQTNGILADEMGLGKTIQTIALLAHLAEEHEIWGPHLIVVPTSVILNWEMEFKKFLPGFKVLSYYGNVEERAQKRKGWSNPDNYNVVITSYQLILKDINSIKVPDWHYMILDEAHNIKNFNSQRYRAMIRLKTHARLLLTGTPLQNNIQELWSLLTFLTAGHDGQGMGELHEFEEWFSKPVNEIFMDGNQTLSGEAQKIVNKLHHSLRPYLLRRLKAHVEKQLPGKYEHTVICRLSKRQRQLYDAFMGLSDTKAKLMSGNMVSVSMALMALRKVCNHPDLFEERPIVTSFAMPKPYSKMPRAGIADYEIKDMLVRRRLLHQDSSSRLDLEFLSLNLTSREGRSGYHVRRTRQLRASGVLNEIARRETQILSKDSTFDGSSFASILAYQNRQATVERIDKIRKYAFLTQHRTDFVPVYGTDLVERATIRTAHDRISRNPPKERALLSSWYQETSTLLQSAVRTLPERAEQMNPLVKKFACITPNVVADNILAYTTPWQTLTAIRAAAQTDMTSTDPLAKGSNEEIKQDAFHESRVRLSIAFPDKRLLQYDCGKLQRLAPLLRSLTSKGSRALIFTQMTSVLDILESFLNIHGYRYLRLDGSTRIEQRQDMMERFNRDTRIDVFILSSRSGGVGMNLTGADTVIFYDLDWNPQMDRQCQDRAHRIGQMRDVHIYKFVSESTIEVNILQKSNQKRLLDEVVIQEGEFTTDWFKQDGQKTIAAEEAKGDEDVAGAAVEKFFGAPGTKAADIGKVLEKVEDAEDVAAARGQQTELQEAGVDFHEDFDKDLAAGSTPHSGPSTPASVIPGRSVTSGDVDVSKTVDAAGVGEGLANDEGVEHDEVVTKGDGSVEEIISVDEYMLRFIEGCLLKGVLYAPPVDRKRARLDRNGRDRSHRAKRIR